MDGKISFIWSGLWYNGNTGGIKRLILWMGLGMVLSSCQGQPMTHPSLSFITENDIRVGAQRTREYFPLLQGKNIGLVANHTTLIGSMHLADSLVSAGYSLEKIFAPEHGFRGDHEAGEEIVSGVDPKTGVKVVSLYGKHKKPTTEDLQGIEVMIYDIQDVGVRFYTYISTMTYIMQACAENDIPLIILDRPNPNGFYVDGPVLDTEYSSFIGLHPVPIVYGMTCGEYALMVNGERWLEGRLKCELKIIEVKGYNHSMVYQLPAAPSPNLPTWQSVYLYPSLGLFEGTFISVGRGTDLPFQVIGHPGMMLGSFVFTPRRIPGVSEYPPYEGVPCYGQNLTGYAENILANEPHFTLQYLTGYHDFFKDSTDFFNPYFEKLAGTAVLRSQIINDLNDRDIRKAWQPQLTKFKRTRVKYLLYP